MKDVAGDNFKFDENGGKFSKSVGKKRSNFSFSHSVFKGLVLQTYKLKGLFRKGLTFKYVLFSITDVKGSLMGQFECIRHSSEEP